MSFNYKRKWNLYPESYKTKEEKDKYREMCGFICPNCKTGFISIWNKDFFETVEDGGGRQLTFDTLYCFHCGSDVEYMVSSSPSQSGTQ